MFRQNLSRYESYLKGLSAKELGSRFFSVFLKADYPAAFLQAFSSKYEALTPADQQTVAKSMERALYAVDDPMQLLDILGHARTIIFAGKEVENFPMGVAEKISTRINGVINTDHGKHVMGLHERAITREAIEREKESQKLKGKSYF